MSIASSESAINKALSIEENQSLFKKVASALKKIADSIRNFIKNCTSNIQAQAWLDDVKAIDELAERLSSAFDKNRSVTVQQKNNTQKGAKYMIEQTENGKQYVLAERQVIRGEDASKWGGQVTNYINENIRKGKDVVVYAQDGDPLTITRDTAGKARFRNDVRLSDGTTRPMTDDEYAVKLRAETHIDELSKVSIRGKKDVPDSKNHNFAKDGFNYRTAYFMDFDGTYYRLTLSVGKNGIINTVYNVGKIKKEDKYSLSGSKPVVDRSTTMRSSSSNKRITQNKSSVNDYSMTNVKNNSLKSSVDDTKKFAVNDVFEETKKLVAVHNLSEEKLIKSLNLGGLPMPSIAILKAKDGHAEFGDVSLVFDKSVIDPRADKRNKVYGGDAWTPIYPTIEYKPNKKRLVDIYHRAKDAKGVEFFKSVYFHPDNIENDLNRWGGIDGVVNHYSDDYSMKNFYLFEHDDDVKMIKKEEEKSLSKQQIEEFNFIISTIGKETIMKLDDEGYTGIEWMKEFGEQYKNALSGYFKSEFADMSAEEVQDIVNGVKIYEHILNVNKIKDYIISGPVETQVVEDRQATINEINRRVNQKDYELWLRDLYDGSIEKSGIRNQKDSYTPTGNRRSFESTHYEETLENVVKAMKEQSEVGGSGIFAGHNLWGVSSKRYNSIDEIKADESRLQSLSEDDFSEIRNNFTERLSEIAQSIMNKKESNYFIAVDNAMECIIDAVRTSKTKSGILKNLREYPLLNVTETAVSDIVDLVKDVSNMPTRYFEAKPQRAVGFEEVATAIIPQNSSDELKFLLGKHNVKYIEYDSEDRQSRITALNSVENVKFSVNDVLDTQSMAETANKINKYDDLTKLDTNEIKVYNDYGWTYQLFTAEDYMLLNEKFNEKYNLNKNQNDFTLGDGSKIVEVNNKLVLIDGSFENPIIYDVLVINADNETDTEIVKEVIFNATNRYKQNRQRYIDFCSICQSVVGIQKIRNYESADFSYHKGQEDTGERAVLPDSFRTYGYTKQFQNRERDNSEVEREISTELIDDKSNIKYAIDDTITDGLFADEDLFGDDGDIYEDKFDRAVKANPALTVIKVYNSAAKTAESGIKQYKDVKLDDKAYKRIARNLMSRYHIDLKNNPEYDVTLAEIVQSFTKRIESGEYIEFAQILEDIVDECKDSLFLSGEIDNTALQEEREQIL